MTTYIYIDSDQRKLTNQSPSNFQIFEDQTTNWSEQPRTIVNNPQAIDKMQSDFLSIVNISDIWIQFSLPTDIVHLVKLNFYNIRYNDKLFNTLGNEEIKFVLSYVKDLNNWVRYKCKTPQFMRIRRKGGFIVTLTDPSDNILNCLTVHMTVSITPPHPDDFFVKQSREL